MATTKLTLSVDAVMIEKAKRYASKHHISVSRLFSDLVSNAVEKEGEHQDPLLKRLNDMDVPDGIKALTGVLKGKVTEDIDHKEAKYEYLKDKYGL